MVRGCSATNSGDRDIGNGGAVYQRDATAVLTQSIFTACSAEGSGGAVSSEGFSRMAVTGVTLTGNIAYTGGGMALTSAIFVAVNNMSFVNNSALFRGGGLYINSVAYVYA